MNVIKLQQDVLSLVRREHDIRRMHDVIDDKFYLVDEKGTALYIISECLWYLSEKIFSNPPALAKVIVEEYGGLKADDLPLKDESITKIVIVSGRQVKCKVLEFDDGEKVYLNLEEAKYLSKSATFYKTRKRGMIKCVEDGEVVAAIGEITDKPESK